MKAEHARFIAFMAGLVVPALFHPLFGIWPLDFLPSAVVRGLYYAHFGILLASFSVGFSWKDGLFFVAPMLLLFPFWIFLYAFAEGWDAVWKATLHRDIYFVLFQSIAAVLGSYLGALFPIRKNGLNRKGALLCVLALLALCVISGAAVRLHRENIASKKADKDPVGKFDVKAEVPVRNIQITPAGPVRIGALEYKTIRVDSLLWMAEDLNHDTRDARSRCYADQIENCRAFGRLYTWEGALDACAEAGWRLPTREEWEKLIHYKRNYKYAYDFLIAGGASGFNARLGGSYQPPAGAFANLGEVGSYWSSTPNPDSSLIWKCGFRKREGIISKDIFPPDWFFSCRCVKDVPVSE